jgi:hypothetical protein
MGAPGTGEPPPGEEEGATRSRFARLWSLRPFVLPGILVGIAVWAGGLTGTILGFVALLVLIDRLLDRVIGFSGWGMVEAEGRFLQLSRQRRRAALERRLRRWPEVHNQLAYLPEDIGWAAIAPRRRLGIQAIRVDSIVGTVDDQKAVAFDRKFRPPPWSRGRWTLMCFAALSGDPLPPISVYRVGEKHFVRDGHHRVSVARSLGNGRIDAVVVELHPPPAD